MARKVPRVPTPAEAEGLQDTPFAASLVHLQDVQPGGVCAAAPVQEPPRSPSWTIARTRKGGLPLAVERRGSGKVVTIIRGIEGEARSLLKELQKACGAGGTVREGNVEIQGNHLAAIEAYLRSAPK